MMKVLKRRWNNISSVLYPLLLGILIIILWQTGLINQMLNIKEMVLPKLSRIFNILKDNFKSMQEDINTTLAVVIVGLLIGSVLGYLLAILASLFPKAGKGGLALIGVFNAIPIVALAPVFINLTTVITTDVEQKAFLAKIIVVTLVTMSAMSITSYRGLTELKPFSKDLLESYACKKFKILWKLRMPNSIPYVFTALKIGIPTAVISTLVCEYFTEATKGVGYKINSLINLSQFSTAWAYIIVACLMGIIMYMILMITEVIILRHRKS
jgi:NitT/TauT family transport system permease protein